MQNQRTTQGVAEILGEIILLAIAVTCISVIYLQVLSTPGPEDTTNVSIVGDIEKGHPIFELQRGESLGPDTKFFITLAGYEQREFIEKDVGGQEWDIGERIVLPIGDITGIQVEATIVDNKTNAIVFHAILQEGLMFNYKGGIWHFDEPRWNGTYNEVKDSSENNNHGRALNNARITTGIKNNAGYFNGYLDTVKVNTSWTLNITNQITIEAWMKPQIPGYISDIVGISGTFGYTPHIIPVQGNIYAIVSEDKQKNGILSTIRIDSEGTISNCYNLTLGKSTASTTLQPKILYVNGKTYLASFIDNKYHMNLQTINISANGSLKNLDQLIFSEDLNHESNSPSLQKITNTLCAIAYWTPNDGGILKTVNISATGKITYTGKMVQYDPIAREPYLIHVTGNVYALAYRSNASNQGVLKTYTITSTGNISYTGKMFVFDALGGYEPCIVQVSTNVIAIAYRNNLNYGVVKTFIIASNGDITSTGKTDIFESTTSSYNPCIIYGESDMFIIAYSTGISTAESSHGFIITLLLESDGSIIPINGSKKQFAVPDGETCHYPIILRIDEDLYGISFTGPQAHQGYLITILIGPHGKGIYKGDSYELYANTTMVEGYINQVRVTYYNRTYGIVWHHFALTYDGLSIRLYVNGQKVSELSYPLHRINLTKAPLYFGRFYCGYIDEIAIYDKALTQEQILNHFMHPGIFE